MENMAKIFKIFFVFSVMFIKLSEPKLPRPWKTTICNNNFTDVDKSDYVKERCSQDEICVPLHYSKIGCANMASLRNTTVNKLSKTTNQSFQPKMKLLNRYADSSEKKTVALFLEFRWFVVKKKMCSQLLPGVN